MSEWTVIGASGYQDRTESAESVEVIEGCLIFSDSHGVCAVYSPNTWRMVVRNSDGRAVA